MQDIERSGLETVSLGKLNMPLSQKQCDMWGPPDLGIQQLKSSVPASPCSPLQSTWAKTQVVCLP